MTLTIPKTDSDSRLNGKLQSVIYRQEDKNSSYQIIQRRNHQILSKTKESLEEFDNFVN